MNPLREEESTKKRTAVNVRSMHPHFVENEVWKQLDLILPTKLWYMCHVTAFLRREATRQTSGINPSL